MLSNWLMTLLSVDTIKDKISEVVDLIAPFVKTVIDAVSNFLNTQNVVLVGCVVVFAALLVIIGLVNFISKKPKLFLTIFLVLFLASALCYFAMR